MKRDLEQGNLIDTCRPSDSSSHTGLLNSERIYPFLPYRSPAYLAPLFPPSGTKSSPFPRPGKLILSISTENLSETSFGTPPLPFPTAFPRPLRSLVAADASPARRRRK
jgi:hypothetical protein